MRIGISTSVIQRGKSGVGQYVMALTRAMLDVASEHELSLFVLKEDRPLLDFAAGRAEIIEVDEIHRPAVKNILWHQSVLPRLAAENRLDVLHVPSYRRLIWKAPCALVATIHDLAPFRLSGKYDWKRMFYGRVVVRRLAHRQDRIIAVSAETASDIVKYFRVPRDKITVIHNGLDHDRFQPGNGRRTPVPSDQNSAGQPFFLYVARLEHPGKNHVRLIEAFEAFKKRTNSSWQLVFGGADWHGVEVIHARAQCSPARDDIKFLGFVSDADLPNLYRNASAFVYPSLFEGFGMPPVEAMASGCPVICSSRGALGEVVGDAALIVNPEDTTEIAGALQKLAQDPSLREAWRERGLRHAQRFNWSLAARHTLDVYSLACGCTSRNSVPAFRS